MTFGFVTLIFITLFLLAVLFADIAWSEGLRRRLEVEQRKNAELAELLDRTMCEAVATQARDRAYANHLMDLRNDAVARANEIIRRERHANDKLHVMLEQKWSESHNANESTK